MERNQEYNIAYIDGMPYAVCLPHGGKKASVAQSEFSMLLRGAGDRNMNCRMASWCSNHFVGTLFDEEEGLFWDAAGYVTQYDGKTENWTVDRSEKRSYGLGFRPVLVPLDKESLEPDLSRFKDLADGSLVQMGTLYMNGKPLLNPIDPVASPMPKQKGHPELGFYPGDVPKYEQGASLCIGDTSKSAEEQIRFVAVGGKLVSDRVLLGCVSYDDLESQFHLSKDVTLTQLNDHKEMPKNLDGPVPLWMRLGVSIDVMPEEIEVLRGEGLSAQEALIQLLCSGRCRIDGDTYFPEDQAFLGDELNFDLPYMTFSAQPPVKERSICNDRKSLSEQIQSASAHAGSCQSSFPIKERDPSF